MSQLMSFREGWQSQNIAKFLLYKFAFLAEPVYSSADDVGTDIFCTLFETEQDANLTYLKPRNSFAIQIKSKDDKSNKFDFTRNVEYLKNLEIPFFIGVVDRDALSMTIYSGEYLVPFFPLKAICQKLEAELCDSSRDTSNFRWLSEHSSHCYTVLFPKVTEIRAGLRQNDLGERVGKIREVCLRVVGNIGASYNGEFIFRGKEIQNTGNIDLMIIGGGPISWQTCENNLHSRLAEVFYNIQVRYNDAKKINDEKTKADLEQRFGFYERIFIELNKTIGEDNLSPVLRVCFRNAKSVIGK